MEASRTPPRANGKLVVLVMLIAGALLGFTLSRFMPRSNPKLAEPGSPYYSPPSNEELKAMRKE